MADLELSAVEGRVRRKRVNKAPDPRFKPDVSAQLDAVAGCPEAFVPRDHLARSLREMLQRLDVKELEKKYSSQGRHGYHPRHMLGALIYGSLVGVHESTKLARLLSTDAAARLVSGGHSISAGRLRAFRRENGPFFQAAIQQTLKLAHEKGLLDPKELAIDSLRVRADASQKAVRLRARAEKRLDELAAIDRRTLTPEQRAVHDEKYDRHLETLRICKEQGVSNFITTCPSASLIQFPSGGSAPGHRATVVGAGVKLRLIVDVLVDASSSDAGQFGPAMLRAREALHAAGIPVDKPFQVAGDPGYFTGEDLVFAKANRGWLDSLIQFRKRGGTTQLSDPEAFTVDDFQLGPDNSMTCPAGLRMEGPHQARPNLKWLGKGCGTCRLKWKCTTGRRRSITLNLENEAARQAMVQRMKEPDAHARYLKRMATIEPVFSLIEDEMGFRRVNSRKEQAVIAEVLLKALAYNLRRLIDATKRLRYVRMFVLVEVRVPPDRRAA